MNENQRKKRIARALNTLSRSERSAIELRFGMRGGRPRTLEEVCQALGVTPKRVRQIEAKVLFRLRHPNHGRHAGDAHDDA